MTVHAADASIHVDVDRVNADETKRLTFAPRKSKHSDSFRKDRGRSRRRLCLAERQTACVHPGVMTSHILVFPTIKNQPISYFISGIGRQVAS